MTHWRETFYKLKGHRVVKARDVDDWSAMFGELSRIVAKTRVGDLVVSTVFLGIDHRGFFEPGPPLVFETMIFDKDGRDVWMDRYSTWKEAELGHAHALGVAEKGGPFDGDDQASDGAL